MLAPNEKPSIPKRVVDRDKLMKLDWTVRVYVDEVNWIGRKREG
jgi:hypothetical protein